MPNLRYALSQSADPEELLEVAMMWKALADTFGPTIHPLRSGQMPAAGDLVFGLATDVQHHAAGTSLPDDYWTLPAFRSRLKRSFAIGTFDQAQDEVDRLSSLGKGAFVKSMRKKEFIGAGDPGASLLDIMGDMAFSHLDYPHPTLIIQERVSMSHEYRCVVVSGAVVAASPVVVSATPNLAHSARLRGHRPADLLYPSPLDELGDFDFKPHITAAMRKMAGEIAAESGLMSGTIDLALVDGKRIEPIEMNIGFPGSYGLFLCDPYAIAEASRAIVPEYLLAPGSPCPDMSTSEGRASWPDEDYVDDPVLI